MELALARTADVVGDPKRVEAHRYRQLGMRLVAQLRENPALDVKREFKRYSSEQRGWVRAGFFQVLIANLSLPNDGADLKKLEILRNGTMAAMKHFGNGGQLFDQIEQYMKRYLEERRLLIENLRGRFGAMLRERAQKMGVSVQIDPAASPEFAEHLRNEINGLQRRYDAILVQLREELQRRFNEQ